jgi:hypothetical protein
MDSFRGYDNVIRDELEDATAVLDAFHVVRLGLKAMEETRRRVLQEQLGHRGRKHNPLYRIRNALRAGVERLTARQITRIDAGLQAGDPHFEGDRGVALLPAAAVGIPHSQPCRRPRHRDEGPRVVRLLPHSLRSLASAAP